MNAAWLFEILQLSLTGILVAIFLNLLFNLYVFKRVLHLKINLSDDFQKNYPLISILIPARNEEARIGYCLDSILKQIYPNLEIYVLDDLSNDSTASIVRERMKSHNNLFLIQGEPLPPGWKGKSWACWQLAEKSKGDFLIFTDADTYHHPMAAIKAFEAAKRTDADLISLWPQQISKSWSEILVIPFVHILILCACPMWLPLRRRELGFANGQFILFKRSTYFELGGHKLVRNHIVEDKALGAEILVRGYKLSNLDGLGLVSCRMYTSFDEIWEGFSKNLRAGFEASLFKFLSFSVFMTLAFLLPFIQLTILGPLWLFKDQLPIEIMLLITSLITPLSLKLILVQILLILTMRLIIALRYRQSLISVLLHPFGYLLCAAIGLNSWYQSARGVVTWKGRTYTNPHTEF